MKEFNKENIEALKNLVKKYRSLTKEDFEIADDEEWCAGKIQRTLRTITNYGSFSCSVCLPVSGDCRFCFWGILNKNFDYPLCIKSATYIAIDKADTFDELKIALNNRADYIEEKLKENNLL